MIVCEKKLKQQSDGITGLYMNVIGFQTDTNIVMQLLVG